MRYLQVKSLPSDAVLLNDKFYTDKYIYEPYVNCFGENVFVRYTRL